MSNSEFLIDDVEQDETRLPDDELYARLNLARDCSPDEICAAFRRLSRIFHPDKHSDPARRQQAQTVFQNIKEAFDVLSDPRRRAIYDMYGKRGLSMAGWELVLRTPTVAEIRAEHERLQRRMEESRLEQKTQPSTRFSFGINATDLFDRYLQEPREERFAPPRIQAGRMSMQQSVLGYLTTRDTVKLAGNISRSTSGFKQASVLQVVWQRLLEGGGDVRTSFEMTDALMPMVSCSVTKTLHPRMMAGCGCNVLLVRRRGGFKSLLGGHATVNLLLAERLRGQMTIDLVDTPTVISNLIWTAAAGHNLIIEAQISTEESSVGISHRHEFEDRGITAEVGLSLTTSGLVFKCRLETQVTSFTKVSTIFKAGSPIGVVVTLRILRGSQTYLIPINLSENVDPVASFYGAVVPLALYYGFKRLLFDPWKERERRKLVAERRRETAAERAEKRREAEAAQLLMTETVRRVRAEEATRRGLLIERAVYGCAAEAEAAARRSLASGGDTEEEATVADVTVALEAMIVNSALIFPGHRARCELPGFYDPCPDEPKLLLVRYRFRGLPHAASFADDEQVRLPQERHRCEEDWTLGDA